MAGKVAHAPQPGAPASHHYRERPPPQLGPYGQLLLELQPQRRVGSTLAPQARRRPRAAWPPSSHPCALQPPRPPFRPRRPCVSVFQFLAADVDPLSRVHCAKHLHVPGIASNELAPTARQTRRTISIMAQLDAKGPEQIKNIYHATLPPHLPALALCVNPSPTAGRRGGDRGTI